MLSHWAVLRVVRLPQFTVVCDLATFLCFFVEPFFRIRFFSKLNYTERVSH